MHYIWGGLLNINILLMQFLSHIQYLVIEHHFIPVIDL